jgi:hypothetical protein
MLHGTKYGHLGITSTRKLCTPDISLNIYVRFSSVTCLATCRDNIRYNIHLSVQ